MDFENERAVLEADFFAKWGNTTKIQWANGPAVEEPNIPWVRFNVLRSNTKQMAISTNATRTMGAVAIQIFTQGDTGASLAWQYADLIALLYNLTSVKTANGYVTFDVCDPEEYGHNSGWYQVNANVPYRRDALKQLIDAGTFDNTVPIFTIDGGSF